MSLVDVGIEHDAFDHKYPLSRRSNSLPSSPPSIRRHSRNSSLSYCKLPEEPIKLSILKLDGSSFDIVVKKTATVSELRKAVEAVFAHVPQKGAVKISWHHVWGHFCLFYGGQKLVKGADHIRNYGIRDGDQLQFVRHISTNNSLIKKHTVRQLTASEQQIVSLPLNEESTQASPENSCSGDRDNDWWQHYNDKEENDIIELNETKWARFFNWWFHYSRLPSEDKLGDPKASSPRSIFGFLGNFRKMIQFCRSNNYSTRDVW